MFTDDTEPVVVRDPRVEMDLPADDPKAEWVSVLQPVHVLVPGYVCACGSSWYALGGDTLEDSRGHYERHKAIYCDAEESDE